MNRGVVNDGIRLLVLILDIDLIGVIEELGEVLGLEAHQLTCAASLKPGQAGIRVFVLQVLKASEVHLSLVLLLTA